MVNSHLIKRYILDSNNICKTNISCKYADDPQIFDYWQAMRKCVTKVAKAGKS